MPLCNNETHSYYQHTSREEILLPIVTISRDFRKGVPQSGQARHAPWNAGNALRAKLYVRVYSTLVHNDYTEHWVENSMDSTVPWLLALALSKPVCHPAL